VDLLFKKTQGNPFFLTQLFTTLHTEGHLRLVNRNSNSNSIMNDNSNSNINTEDAHQLQSYGYWECDIKQINKMNYTENVVDLVVTRIRKMEPSVQRLLSIAATIGPSFQIHLLPPLLGLPRRDVSCDLKSSLHESFIMPVDIAAELALDDDAINDLTARMGDVPGLIKAEQKQSRYSVGHCFKFTHDRVQQAAASLLEFKEIQRIHFQVAQVC
jgi:predicted ATPase